jgi:uncharacterized protein (TIGR03905 family)
MKYTHKTTGTCSVRIDFEIDDKGNIHNAQFIGGCAGNTKAVAALVEGMAAKDVITRLEGIPCREGTSCPDQFAKALKKVLAK